MKIPRSKAFWLVFPIGILLFTYACIKSATSSFTHDESFSYLVYVHDHFMDILSFANSYTNNHILNTLAMKYSEKLFGSSEIALRLPNLILFLVYMWYCYLLFKKEKTFLVVAAFILLCTNTLLADLFGLARGYGMSCGFMLMSLYHFLQFLDVPAKRHLILFHAASLLAILSSFTLAPFYAASLLVYTIIIFLDHKFISKKKYHFFRSIKVHIIPFLIVTAILYEPVRRLIKFGTLDFGGKEGFYENTITSLINNSFYGIPLSPGMIVCVQVIFTGIIFLSSFIIFRKIKSGDQVFFTKHKALIVSDLLIIFLSIAFILQHTFFGIDYPVGRFSVFFYPLFTIHLFFLLSYFATINSKATIYGALALALFSATAFAVKADIHSSAEWKFDSQTKNMLLKLKAQHAGDKSSKKIKIGINWLFQPSIEFYRQTTGLDWLLPIERSAISENDNYYYIFKEDQKLLDTSAYIEIAGFEDIHTVLLKNIKR
ncbi:MAG: glycosyltransferase family 39 protein [Bacteroidota bacterium]|nr:glycosyltransferase family 39 protein [Bacteroidota bacterium]